MDGKSIGAVASYKFVKVQTAHTIEARFATAPMKDPDTGFSDIAKSDYFYDAVKWAVGSKVTSGLTETTFGPQETWYARTDGHFPVARCRFSADEQRR